MVEENSYTTSGYDAGKKARKESSDQPLTGRDLMAKAIGAASTQRDDSGFSLSGSTWHAYFNGWLKGYEETARYKVRTIGPETEILETEIEADSFQDAARQMLERHNLTSVVSVVVKWNDANGGTIEFTECEIRLGVLKYIAAYVLDTKEGTEAARERLYALLLPDEEK